MESKNRSAIGIKATSPEHKELLDKLHNRTICVSSGDCGMRL